MNTQICSTTLLLFTACFASLSLAADPVKKSAIEVKLTLDVEEYDPHKPSPGVLKCVVKNTSDKAVTIPTRLGWGSVDLRAGGVYLWIRSKEKTDPETEKMELTPGKEQTLFGLKLDDILKVSRTDEAKAKYAWTWERRPASPLSPIHKWRMEGYVEETSFSVQISLDKDSKESARSESVKLKIKPSQPAEPK